MINKGKGEIERMNVRNDLEEFIYEIREQMLASEGNDEKWIFKQFATLLNTVETWLYADGERCNAEKYDMIQEKLKTYNVFEKFECKEIETVENMKVEFENFNKSIEKSLQ